MIFKSFNNFGNIFISRNYFGSRSKVLVILIKYVSKIPDNLLSSETMRSFCEIIILLEKFPLPEKYGLIVCQKYLSSDASFGFTFEK